MKCNPCCAPETNRTRERNVILTVRKILRKQLNEV